MPLEYVVEELEMYEIESASAFYEALASFCLTDATLDMLE